MVTNTPEGVAAEWDAAIGRSAPTCVLAEIGNGLRNRIVTQAAEIETLRVLTGDMIGEVKQAQQDTEAVLKENARLREAAKQLLIAVDDYGVNRWDTDSFDDDVQAVYDASQIVRELLFGTDGPAHGGASGAASQRMPEEIWAAPNHRWERWLIEEGHEIGVIKYVRADLTTPPPTNERDESDLAILFAAEIRAGAFRTDTISTRIFTDSVDALSRRLAKLAFSHARSAKREG